MESRLAALVDDLVQKESLIQAVFSDPSPSCEAKKVTARPILLKGQPVYQMEYTVGKQTIHRNLDSGEFKGEVLLLMERDFRQALIYAKENDYHLSVSASGNVGIKSKPATKVAVAVEHDRKKNHLIPEGEPCDFLIRLGVMTRSGQVITSKYHKFRQINRFLELVDDMVGSLDKDRELTVVDFGCGKSYLTFALYHLLKVQRRFRVRIIGLDLKADVIAHCQRITDDLGYSNLSFQVGDIAGYQGLERVDMVVALHACDTATDDALAKAMQWQAKVILAVPCCQHELLNKIKNADLQPMLKHGLIKERLSSLVTDTLRAQLLEANGYDVQMVEFIDMEHTPKNILIRAIRGKSKEASAQAEADYEEFKKFWSV